MRGQLEKLQSDRSLLERYLTSLKRVSTLFEDNLPASGKIGATKATVETVELMIQAQEAERQRLSRQMHDGPAQALSNFILQTEIAMRLFDLDQAKAREELEILKLSASATCQKVRDFNFELRPMMLDDLGLAPTIKRYVDAVKEQFNVHLQILQSGSERRLENYLGVMVFRAVQELVVNSIHEGHASNDPVFVHPVSGETLGQIAARHVNEPGIQIVGHVLARTGQRMDAAEVADVAKVGPQAPEGGAKASPVAGEGR